MIDDVKAELPVEIKRAKDLVANKNDYVASAKREADDLRHQAEDYAKRLVNEDAIVREAEKQADEILAEAEEQCRMLRAAASEYCEDTLRRMEEAVADAYDEVKRSRAKFRSAWGQTTAAPPRRSQSAPPSGHVRRRGRRGRRRISSRAFLPDTKPIGHMQPSRHLPGRLFFCMDEGDVRGNEKEEGASPKPPRSKKGEKTQPIPKNSCFLQGRNL